MDLDLELEVRSLGQEHQDLPQDRLGLGPLQALLVECEAEAADGGGAVLDERLAQRRRLGVGLVLPDPGLHRRPARPAPTFSASARRRSGLRGVTL